MRFNVLTYFRFYILLLIFFFLNLQFKSSHQLSRGELSPGHMYSDFLVLDAVWSGLYPVSLTTVKSRYFEKFELVMFIFMFVVAYIVVRHLRCHMMCCCFCLNTYVIISVACFLFGVRGVSSAYLVSRVLATLRSPEVTC